MSKTLSLPKVIIVTGLAELFFLDVFTDTKNSDLWMALIAISCLAIAVKYVWKNND